MPATGPTAPLTPLHRMLVVDSTAPRSSRDGTVELLAHREGRQLLATLTVSEGRLHELDCTSMGAEAFLSLTMENLDGWESSVAKRTI